MDVLNPDSLSFAENLYAKFLQNPQAVPAEWRQYFEQFPERPARHLAPTFRPSSIFQPDARATVALATLQHRVDEMVRNYRVRGHMIAAIDPLGIPRPQVPELEIGYYHLSDSDLDQEFTTNGGESRRTLRSIIQHLRNTYCRSIGVQFMHIDDIYVRRWLQERMERGENRIELKRAEQLQILTRLTDAVIFEEFVQKKYTGAKTFSLEGAESLIPLLALAMEKAAEENIEAVVLGMAHRGRLNVLANIAGKSPSAIFREFEDRERNIHFQGDVKYHLGHRTVWHAASGKMIHLSLQFNPSHLEFVNPVAIGRMRAIQDRMGDVHRQRGLTLLVHGDAAFAGEGVVQETLNLSELESYTTGGTVHVILNNQIGFTTEPSEGRSSTYATDVAKMLQTPIFHVNGEDPEAVAQVIRLSMDFRQMFQRDVFIDMYCYRRRGHNEADEAAFTQPLMAHAIEQRKSVRDSYVEHLLKLGGVTQEEADLIAVKRRENLEQELSLARQQEYVVEAESAPRIWQPYRGGLEKDIPEPETAIDEHRAAELLEIQTRLPADFHPHPKIERLLQHRLDMAAGKRPLDWSAAEALAFARLATDGIPVRLSGQDSERGTFSHRHAALHDTKTGQVYVPLQHLSKNQAPVEIYNSPLSEVAVLGFEYGYTLDYPNSLVAWEAQFGDFWNAAQVIVDQFIASAEEKWRQLSGLVMLLPTGFEGMGPEHSSARLERFLLLAANDNLQIVTPTTPAQYFHCLSRQMLRTWRKPLIVMTPKSLLRDAAAVSPLADFAHSRFQRIIPDSSIKAERADLVLLCTGKIYYELVRERQRLAREDVAILRLEQLYPLPDPLFSATLSTFHDGTPVVWVQEEPENMGAWRYLRNRFGETLFGRFPFSGVYRPASASPATGSASTHRFEQQQLIRRAFSALEHLPGNPAEHSARHKS
jgi:2-oxoglutarate dehydrogenase E1 component